MRRMDFIAARAKNGLFWHIAYHASAVTRIDTPTTTQASIGATLHTTTGTSLHIISAHLPHHATLEQTQQLLHAWQDNHPHFRNHPCIIGADWNETFNTQLQTAVTSRGEIILEWISQHSQHMPPQQDDIPSYHPYHKTYGRGSVPSDHDAVVAEITTQPYADATKQPFTHYPMKIKIMSARVPPPPPIAHPWDSLTHLALNIMEAYPKPKFQESRQLKQHKHKLGTGQIPAD